MGTLAAHDHARALGPLIEFEALGDLGDLRAGAFTAVLAQGRTPGVLGERDDRFAHLLPVDATGTLGRASLPGDAHDLDGDAVEVERLHRARANAEDRVRAAKHTGLENLPFREFALNAVWFELSLIAQDLSVWTQTLCLDGDLAICEPKALRYRLLHTAARLALNARRATLRLQASWPWASRLAAAFARLQALPPPAA